MYETDFDKNLKWTKFALLLSGIKVPNTAPIRFLENFITHHLFYCNFIALYTVIFGEIYWVIDGIQSGKNFVEVSLTAPCITVSILGTFKSIFVYLNKDILYDILHRMKRIHPTDSLKFEDKGFEKLKIFTASIRLLKYVFLLFNCICIMMFIMFCFLPILLIAYDYYKSGEWVITYPFLVKYFLFDAYNTRWSPLIYLHQVWSTIIVINYVYGCDTLYYSLCIHIDMHFQLLGLRLENIVADSLYETKMKLNEAVIRHQELIHLVNQAEILFTKSSLFNVVSSSLLICLSAFNITVAEEFSTIIAFFAFLTMSISQISLVCFFADMLMTSSTKICESIYKCLWYDTDTSIKKTVHLVMIRSQRASKLTAWNFADLNLRTFTGILKTSWSYFALLRTMYEMK